MAESYKSPAASYDAVPYPSAVKTITHPLHEEINLSADPFGLRLIPYLNGQAGFTVLKKLVQDWLAQGVIRSSRAQKVRRAGR